jgi:D-glycerate 3-kinase
VVVAYDNTLDGLPQWQKRLLQRHHLPPSYLASAQYWFDPLAESMVVQQEGARRPLLFAVNGSQGSGKSTLCAYLEMAIATRYHLKTVTLSLDDFYYTREQRLALSQDVHPLLLTRGVPGTHDIALLGEVLAKLLARDNKESVAIPRFDKATDDRMPQWEDISGSVDIVLLEGWCLGARPQPVEQLVEPINALEMNEDPHGIWRNYVNSILARDFLPLYKHVDHWVMLQAPGFECVYEWRREQEAKLALDKGGKSGRRIMNEVQLARFIQFYERLTQVCLRDLPAQVDQLYALDEKRRVTASHKSAGF